MACTFTRLTLNTASLPGMSNVVGARFDLKTVTNVKGQNVSMVLVGPRNSELREQDAVGPEPYLWTVLCEMQFQAYGSPLVQGSGQLVITGQRFLGMIDAGTEEGSTPINRSKDGSVYCFSIPRDDVGNLAVKKRMIKPFD